MELWGPFIIGIVIILVVGIYTIYLSAGRTRKAQAQYLASLEKLKADPGNSALKQETLRLGRLYALNARDFKGVAITDEVMIANDINAATAGASHAPSSADELLKFKQLMDTGTISQAEYEAKKRQILG